MIPFFCVFGIVIFNLILMLASDIEFFYLPAMESWVGLIHFVYFIWIWAVGVNLNRVTLKKGDRLFKACFFAYLFYLFYSFIAAGFVDFPKYWTNYNTFISITVYIYGLFTLFSFFYMSWFAGKVVSALPPLEWPSKYESIGFPNVMSLIVFPIGIPLLQRRVRQAAYQHELFGLVEKFPSRLSPVTQPKSEETLKNESTESKSENESDDQNSEEDDWSRYLPD